MMTDDEHANPCHQEPKKVESQKIRPRHGLQKTHFALHLASAQLTTASMTGKRRSCQRSSLSIRPSFGCSFRLSSSRKTSPSMLNCCSIKGIRAANSFGTDTPSSLSTSEN